MAGAAFQLIQGLTRDPAAFIADSERNPGRSRLQSNVRRAAAGVAMNIKEAFLNDAKD